jgi:ankyrin repeat protein
MYHDNYQLKINSMDNQAQLALHVYRYERRPLNLAAGNGHEATVRRLLDRGADIEAKDKDSRAPLHLSDGAVTRSRFGY